MPCVVILGGMNWPLEVYMVLAADLRKKSIHLLDG